MAISRRHIVGSRSVLHITWRCLNREFFLEHPEVKDFILKTWAKNKHRYNVRIYDFAIMDNHVHMLARAETVDKLANFMRHTNSLIARFINGVLGRDSHALRERYKSPVITSKYHLINTMGYIWFNRTVATGEKPEDFKYGSLFYRVRGLRHPVLDSYGDLPLSKEAEDKPQKYVTDMLNAFKSKMKQKLQDWTEAVYEHAHTIGQPSIVIGRSLAIRAASAGPPGSSPR